MIGGRGLVTAFHQRYHNNITTPAVALALLLSSQFTSLAFHPSPTFSRNKSFTGNNMSASSSSSSSSPTTPLSSPIPRPPLARREENRTILAGKLPSNHPLLQKLTRQSTTSDNPLLDPARSVPDPYGWLRDEARTNDEVLHLLNEENAYTAAVTSHLDSLRGTLYEEMVGSLQETDYTAPANKENKYWYYTRTNKGQSYKVYCRAPYRNDEDVNFSWDGSVDAPVMLGEEQFLDVNVVAKGQSYCSVSSVAVSKSQKLVGYMLDVTGDEIYSLYVRNLETGEMILEETSIDCSGSVTWGHDENTVFYLKLDETQRPYQVYRRLLDGSKEDELLFEQDDPQFWTSVSKSSDEKYLLIETASSETSEVHYLDLTTPNSTLICVARRRSKVLYDVDHWNGYWVITSNVDKTPNMRLMVCKVGEDESHWKDVVGSKDGSKLFDGGYDRSLEGVDAFGKNLVASGRSGGIPAVWVLTMGDNRDDFQVTECTQLTFDEDAYDVGVGVNYNYDSDKLVLYYDSLITPLQSLQVSMNDPNNAQLRTVLKSKNVPGYVKADYGCFRTTVMSRDGETKIPVSFVYRQDVMKRHTAAGETVPVHLYGYGSYGMCCEADFSATRLSLLNRGMVFVVAHVRGGAEMGRQWYEEPNGAKYLCKKNTFNDFVDIAKWLIEDKKLTTPQQLSIEGRSAGGLLIGASINQAPEMFRVAILGVPFVDVVATMVDSSIPLTTNEWEEWGNPNEEKFFNYMMEYSPVNNVKKGVKYPSCLLTGGLHDPRVQYWEPAKFAAELRHAHNDSDCPTICLKMDMTAGHFSASDRYKYLKELSFDYAFLLDQLGLSETPK